MTDFGIDVSHHNTVRDWNAVRGANITYCSVKLTDDDDFIDKAAAGHVDGARAAGITLGGYHFAGKGSIDTQVSRFVDRLTALSLMSADCLMPMLDMEEKGGLRPRANPFIEEFIATFRAVTGQRRIFVYANFDWLQHVLEPDQWMDDDVFLWIARYNGDPGNPGFSHPRLALHQHSEHGQVDGIKPKHIDRDATMAGFTLADLLVGAPGGGAAPVIPAQRQPVQGATPTTHVVVAGDTLTKIAKRHGTTVAILVALNHIANPDFIPVGQVLALPQALIPA